MVNIPIASMRLEHIEYILSAFEYESVIGNIEIKVVGYSKIKKILSVTQNFHH